MSCISDILFSYIEFSLLTNLDIFFEGLKIYPPRLVKLNSKMRIYNNCNHKFNMKFNKFKILTEKLYFKL